jgi:hypothetical protein
MILGKVALASGGISIGRRIQQYFMGKESARSFGEYVVKIKSVDFLSGAGLVGAHILYKKYKSPRNRTETPTPRLEQIS